MANLHHMITIAGRVLMVGLLFFLLQGCKTPLVKIDVSATTKAAPTGKCTPGQGGSGDNNGLSGCLVFWNYSGSADHFWHADENKWIASGSGLTCGSGSSKCLISGQPCQSSKGLDSCTSVYSGGMCGCACGQP